MTEPPDTDPQLGADQRRLADRLEASRPVPAGGFRGALARHLAARDPGHGPRPARLRLISGGCLIGGAGLLVLGLLQALGSL